MVNNDTIDLKAIARRAMHEYNFRPNFPSDVLSEVSKLKEPLFKRGSARDLSALLWSSIDNDDSRDLDQAEYVEVDGDAVTAYVAVADVDYFVPKGSLTDTCARYKTTSIYTAVENFPMLPDRLSTNLCSLIENVKRLSIVIEMKIAKDGELVSSSVYPAIIQNQAQLTYAAVHAWLAGSSVPNSAAAVQTIRKIEGNGALQRQLQIQDRITQALRVRRQEHGALDFQPPPITTESNDTEGASPAEPSRSTRIIEELMVAANRAVDLFLESKKFPFIQRVVRTPRNWPRMVEIAASHGEMLPQSPDSRALETFLTKRRKEDPERFPDVAFSIIKLLGRGEYVVKDPGGTSLGHFALAVSNYAHSTGPNRRYPDLITQRLLRTAHAGTPPPYTLLELTQLASLCTSREEDANGVERQVRASVAAAAFAPRIGEEFTAFITGHSADGAWVRVALPQVEGVIRGATARTLPFGAKVKVRLSGADPTRGIIDFTFVEGLNA